MLILVARQNGKTHLLRVLKLYWLFVEQWPVVLGTSTDRTYAKKDWQKLCDMAKDNPYLRAALPQRKNLGVCTQIGEEALTTAEGCQYTFAATNRRAGRSLSIDRLVIDELREHTNWDTWNAATNAMNARPLGQVYCITNQGDDTGVVLDSLHARALKAIKSGNTETRLGLFEWSAPDGADLMDPDAWAAANPNLGRRIDPDSLREELERAKEKGGEEEASARTEILCQRVKQLDGAVDAQAWTDCLEVGSLKELRSRVALCVDISPDRRHATLAAAAVQTDGRARVEVVASWSGIDATQKLRAELLTHVQKIKPQAFCWMPNGPAAALTAELQKRKGSQSFWPSNIAVEEIRAEVSAVCMGLSELVDARQVVHSGQELLDTHVTSASKLWSGDTWRFSRKGEGHCDGAYAAAGAIHLARTLPAPVGKPRLVINTA
ncbi:terminase [Micromonospora mirobrigensis]|uniref:Phage Terminase n=1 Tax=Micromonospora mirobrigensis TaxID=262898 RepID=A0A1C4XDA6_9ACTN|nr:terminase [Micromonospora mirobrigensis]SCF06473.1 Phage Terminase [Micromonospora mirobrigensis]